MSLILIDTNDPERVATVLLDHADSPGDVQTSNATGRIGFLVSQELYDDAADDLTQIHTDHSSSEILVQVAVQTANPPPGP